MVGHHSWLVRPVSHLGLVISQAALLTITAALLLVILGRLWVGLGLSWAAVCMTGWDSSGRLVSYRPGWDSNVPGGAGVGVQAGAGS